MSQINQGEVDTVIFAGLRQLADLGYHRAKFYQDGHETAYYVIDHVERGEPVWKKVTWSNGKPELVERKGL